MYNRYLALDSTQDTLVVVAKNGNNIVCKSCTESKMQHAQLCMPIIEEVLLEAKMHVNDCQFFAAVTGPGSFTGIRIGLSTILGLANASKKKVIGVTSFQLLSYDKLERFLAVIAAGKNFFYVCGYENGKMILPPTHISLAKLQNLSKEYLLYTFTPLPFPCIQFDRIKCIQGVIEKAVQENFISYPLSAFYVKKSQAEENLIAKMGK